MEDKVYAENPTVQQNLWRGNTFIETSNGEIDILRKGLPKFFDIWPVYVENYVQNKAYDEEHGFSLKQDEGITQSIFSDV